jgi:hypothetical protein
MTDFASWSDGNLVLVQHYPYPDWPHPDLNIWFGVCIILFVSCSILLVGHWSEKRYNASHVRLSPDVLIELWTLEIELGFSKDQCTPCTPEILSSFDGQQIRELKRRLDGWESVRHPLHVPILLDTIHNRENPK